MNRARLRELGFELAARAERGESGGAWFAMAPDGAPVVLTWFPDETVAGTAAARTITLDLVGSRDVPRPVYERGLYFSSIPVASRRSRLDGGRLLRLCLTVLPAG